MSVCIITGSAGLIGSEATRWFAGKGLDVVGLDNDMRATFFGDEASTQRSRLRLANELGNRYTHHETDIRDQQAVDGIFEKYGSDISLIIHTAAQPSHDWAARDPHLDFSVNANGTLNLLESTRNHCPDAVFIFTSTNKVYGDTPNELPLRELETRWEIEASHPYFNDGIPESMSVDQCKHSLFGASKVAADILVQEYGRYFGMKTTVFRGGCLTGPNHSGTELHGFLSYLVKCAVTSTPYNVFGYKGKQVRDNIHSFDLITCFDEVFRDPGSGEVFNIGGGRHSNCSLNEAATICSELASKPMNLNYLDENRIGDHIWYISDLTRFKSRYPNWTQQYNIQRIISEIYDFTVEQHG